MKNACIPNAKANLNTKLSPFEDFHLYTLDVKSVKTNYKKTKQNKNKNKQPYKKYPTLQNFFYPASENVM